MLAASQGVVSGCSDKLLAPPSAQTAAPAGFSRGGFGVGLDWAAALELTIATNGAEPYKSRLQELFPQMITPQQMDLHGWTAVRALPYLDASAKDQMREAVKTYMAGLDKRLDATPFGVPPSLGTWGGSGAVVDMAIRMYFLHKAFPDLVGTEYTLRAVNYILGTHPVSSTSYVAGVGTVSKTHDVQQQSRRQCLHPGCRDSGIHHHQAGFSGVHRRLRIPVV